MNRSTLAFLTASLVLALCMTAYAEDLVPPPWRTTPPGAPPTTYQRWEFNTSANPVGPDFVANPYGLPSASLEYSTWIPVFQGASGVWYVEGLIALQIPNRPIIDERKEIWLQVTYLNDTGQGGSPFEAPEVVLVPDAIGSEYLVSYQALGTFYHAVYSITIEPNPAQETIYILPRGCAVYIDEVVVDTRCIPEPGSALLLAAVALGIRRR